MKKLFNVLAITTFAVMTLSQAEAGRGGGAAPQQPAQGAGGGQGQGGVQAPTGVDLAWCRGKNHCVEVQLSNTPGRTGALKLYSLNSAGTAYNATLTNCPATGGYDTHPDGQRSKKTPAGVHSVIDTGDRLVYNGREVNMYNPTYFKSFRPWSENRMAIHSGHRAGSNSHGCVRTSDNCAATVRRKADEDQSELKIRITYF
jgi:hypothetical protein